MNEQLTLEHKSKSAGKPRIRAGAPAVTPGPKPNFQVLNPPAAPVAAPAPAQPTSPVLPAVPAPTEVDGTLRTILCWKRPHSTASELGFCAWLRGELQHRGATPEISVAGNIVAEVRTVDNKSVTTMFSCHVDTMHSDDKAPRQKIVYDPNFGHIFLDQEDRVAGNCLGADDGAGVWLMLEMISAKVPGTYVFHRGEERGFVGSRAMLDTKRAWLESFEVAVAFDRPYTTQVITHQGGSRCCSDKFASKLAEALNEASPSLQMVTYDGGGVTDTSVYRGVIAECCNVAVGYEKQHRSEETLDYGHLVHLRDACVKLNWNALPVDRDPKKVDPLDNRWGGYKGSYGNYKGENYDFGKQAGVSPFPKSGAQGKFDDPAFDYTEPKAKPKKAKPLLPQELLPEQEFEGQSFVDVLTFVEEHPEEATRMLIELAADLAGLRAKVDYLKGTLQ